MIKMLIVGLISIAAAPSSNDATQSEQLPSDWHGSWEGTMDNIGAANQTDQVAMSFEIGSIEGSNEIRWVTVFRGDQGDIVKDYIWIPIEDSPGRFRIDEQNGIDLDARRVGSVIYAQFAVDDQFLTARYELMGDELRYELTSAVPVEAENGEASVQRYEVQVIQRARLSRRR